MNDVPLLPFSPSLHYPSTVPSPSPFLPVMPSLRVSNGSQEIVDTTVKVGVAFLVFEGPRGRKREVIRVRIPSKKKRLLNYGTNGRISTSGNIQYVMCSCYYIVCQV